MEISFNESQNNGCNDHWKATDTLLLVSGYSDCLSVVLTRQIESSQKGAF